MVDLGTKFTPRKIYFTTENEATAEAAKKKTEYLAHLAGQKLAAKKRVAFNWFNLDNTQQNNLATAFAAVNGDTAGIIRALTFYKKHTSTADASRKLQDVFTEYMAAKTAAGRRQRTIDDAKGKLTPFVNSLGNTSITEITTADVEGWLNGKGNTATTRNAYRVAISGLFAHAVKRRYVEYNPAAAIEAVTVDQGLPSIHTPPQVKAMLRAASNFVPSRYVVAERDTNRKVTKGEKRPTTNPAEILKARLMIVPYLALGYFAGLRPENELANLDWKDIDFEAKTIRVDPATAKNRRQRYVDMSDNLIKWLTPYAFKSGKIGFSRKIFHAVREASGVAWSKDVMRHSFGSYLLEHNQDAPKTALQMGHTSVNILFNHYRNLVKKSAAADYWNIVPENDAKITASSVTVA
jgi:integrase